TMSSDREISSSVTVRTSTPCRARMPNGTAPGVPTAMPSAIVAAMRAVVGSAAVSDAGYAAARSACTPTTRTCGAVCANAAARPATRPPPPSGATTVRTSGTCSRISSAIVAWPATTSGWSNGWMNTAPVRSASARAAARVSSTSAPTSRTSAPYWRVAATLGSAASTGMYTTARMPSMPAANATPCASLPALAATTPPGAFSASLRRAMRTYAPRTLNDPARCRFSHLSSTRTPAASLIARVVWTGVRYATPSSRRAASRTSSSVTGATSWVTARLPARRPPRPRPRARRRESPRRPTARGVAGDGARPRPAGRLRRARPPGVAGSPARRSGARDLQVGLGARDHRGLRAPPHDDPVLRAELGELVVPVQVQHDGVEDGRERHREQRADDPRREAPRGDDEQHGHRVQRDRVAHEERLEDVPLDLLHEQHDPEHDERLDPALRDEHDEHRDRAGDDGTDDRDERADEHEDAERHREAGHEERRADPDADRVHGGDEDLRARVRG